MAGTAKLAAFMADTARSADADDAYSTALMRRHGVSEPTVETLESISRAFRRYLADAEVTRILADRGELVAGDRIWRVHERPGHSPTDTVLAGDGLMITGDHLLGKISSNPVNHVPIGTPDPDARTAASVGRAMWRHVPVTQAYLVLSEVLGHLDLLERRGAVACEERDGVVVYVRA